MSGSGPAVGSEPAGRVSASAPGPSGAPRSAGAAGAPGSAGAAGAPGPTVGADDRAIVAAQLGRAPRAIRAVAHRCACGHPDVIETSPRLPDGTPFPTLYYLTCPRAASAVGTLEASGLMTTMSARLAAEPELAARYRAAHEAYLARRRALGDVPEIDAVSAGGMPTRVKCLHVLVAHSLAAGPGVNPLGDEALSALPPWGAGGPCVPAQSPAGAAAVAPPAVVAPCDPPS